MAKHGSLAARYRPQTFAEVIGQGMISAVLSRACVEDSPACAYLLSGTRGVGKTTTARIFAKALNCEHAPGPEPCNACPQCRKITQGNHVDVIEIDGASNTGVDDIRALRETVGYAPMEGRYKIFIIDEAHMLSKSAFNALLKTLEEPPPRVIFIFATTEANRFPPTIVSRCQQFTFRHLGEEELVTHLRTVLEREQVQFEDGAVRLIARRAAGSVRDGMSLLDQTLSLADSGLTVPMTRQILGLAGQELFGRLFDALHARDCAAIVDLSGQTLRQGVDIGFFVRELIGYLRNLFLLRQGGAAMLPNLGLPEEEGMFLASLAPQFSAAHLHAAWQMALDAQRAIAQSPEPAAALELLLLNLALLPRLLPLEALPASQENHSQPPAADTAKVAASPSPPATGAPEAAGAAAPAAEAASSSAPSSPIPKPQERAQNSNTATPVASGRDAAPACPPRQEPPAATTVLDDEEPRTPDWPSFCDFLQKHDAFHFSPPQIFRSVPADWRPDTLRLLPKSRIQADQLGDAREAILAWLGRYLDGQPVPELDIVMPEELVAEFNQKPELQPCFEILKASVTHCEKI